MSGRTSLFARRLREYRSGAGAGPHGRMTQEQLAVVLGVSVEAVGKYERSLSFIRGDLESRLTDNLGWTAADVTACRMDWHARLGRSQSSDYRVFDAADIGAARGTGLDAVTRDVFVLLDAALPSLPPAFEADDALWSEIYSRHAAQTAYVLHGSDIVGHWAVPFLHDDDAKRFRARQFVEADFCLERVRRALLPGRYFAYCTGIVIAPGHEAAATLMLNAFVDLLEDLAARDIILDGIGATAVTAEGRQLCRELGFVCLGSHMRFPDFGVWELRGDDIARSLFGRRSPALQAAYLAAFSDAPRQASGD